MEQSRLGDKFLEMTEDYAKFGSLVVSMKFADFDDILILKYKSVVNLPL